MLSIIKAIQGLFVRLRLFVLDRHGFHAQAKTDGAMKSLVFLLECVGFGFVVQALLRTIGLSEFEIGGAVILMIEAFAVVIMVPYTFLFAILYRRRLKRQGQPSEALDGVRSHALQVMGVTGLFLFTAGALIYSEVLEDFGEAFEGNVLMIFFIALFGFFVFFASAVVFSVLHFLSARSRLASLGTTLRIILGFGAIYAVLWLLSD